VYDAKGDIDSFALICSAICLISKDCWRLAQLAEDQENYDLALKWITRGLAIDDLSPVKERCAEHLTSLRSCFRAKRHRIAKSHGQKPPPLDDV
jgi:hypothetical protein